MRTYALLLENTAISTAISLLELTASAASAVILLEAWVTQESSITSAQLAIQILRKSAAGTGTGSPTAKPLEVGEPAFGGTVRVQMTAEGTAGNVLWREGVNQLNGWYYKPVPEARIWVPPSGILAVKLPVAPASINVSAGMIFAEVA